MKLTTTLCFYRYTTQCQAPVQRQALEDGLLERPAHRVGERVPEVQVPLPSTSHRAGAQARAEREANKDLVPEPPNEVQEGVQSQGIERLAGQEPQFHGLDRQQLAEGSSRGQLWEQQLRQPIGTAQRQHLHDQREVQSAAAAELVPGQQWLVGVRAVPVSTADG